MKRFLHVIALVLLFAGAVEAQVIPVGGVSAAGGGDASAANQSTMITSLQIIDNMVFGAGTAAAAQRVTFASDAPTLTVAPSAGSFASDMTVGTVFGTTGPGGVYRYLDFDGSALPTATNVDTEGEAVPPAASIKGVIYNMWVSEDGSLQ